MSIERRSLDEHVNALRVLDVDGRLSYLQRLIGSHTKNAYELDWRAKLMSTLNRANIWPPREGDGQQANYGINPG